MPYIHFTDEQKLRANSVDLVEFLRRQGEKLIPSGRDKRLASDHSITVRGNEWYDHEAEEGGGPISFVQTFYGLSYSMHLHHFESPEDEDKPFDMEEPNFFGVSIAYDPYMREVVKAEQFTTCGGDGGRSICGGLGIFLGFLPCSPHCKPEVQEDKELNGDYDFYRPIIRVDVN